ncbi:hypothetical protein B0O99DRAFT_610118 [Bisporella sp. PMI_857]|nr:hypothetical protein B0O99DRAFT_610118 [Bisporella sp. PMI_857]
MDRTSARLRKTFRYPTDNDSDDSLPEAMDEQEQENLIAQLSRQTQSQNKLYAQILLVLSLLCIPPYIPTLFYPSTSILSLLSISSLLSTAFLIHILPPTKTSISFLDALSSPPSNSRGSGVGIKGNVYEAQGPLEKYLPYLNGVLCILLGILGTVFRAREEVWRGFGWVPGVIYGVVLVGKVVMAGVDPEGELKGLRYEFKGA